MECLCRIHEQTMSHDAKYMPLGGTISTVANLWYSEHRTLDSSCHQSDLSLCISRAHHLLRGMMY